jgi:type VI secretion system protein ImpK
MSQNDDPFGRSDRTIIRPNPGGRRPAEPPPQNNAPPPPPPRGAPPSSPPRGDVSYPAPPAYPPQPRGDISYSSQQSGPAGSDMWMSRPQQAPGVSPYMQASAAQQPMTPAPAMPHVSVDLGAVARDPLVRSAASLLLLLGRLRASLSRARAGQLMDQVAQAIQQFETDARAGGASVEQTTAGKYALAATADDIVQNLPGEAGVWSQYSMLVRFFSERTGGVKFFQELERAKQNPTVNLGLLELMHACLCLGFEGVYRATRGAGDLQNIRRDLFETIRRAAPLTDSDLSPHWRGQTIALAGSRLQIPVWLVGAIAAALAVGVYLVLRNMLSVQAEDLAQRMASIHPIEPVSIARAEPVKPPPQPLPPPPQEVHKPTQLERIKAALADEIVANKVAADENDTSIFVRIGSLVLFPSGGATVNDSFAPIAKKIAAALDKEPGDIRIVGHTDNDPIKTVAFPSNFELSLARAKSVAVMMKKDLAKPERVTVGGKGADQPIAPNDVEANKAKNRRVEISIPRAD